MTLVRLGAVTHSFNMSQRFNRLSFSAGPRAGLMSSAPANGNLAPLGHYMLFILNASGVPSVAKIVRLDAVERPHESGRLCRLEQPNRFGMAG